MLSEVDRKVPFTKIDFKYCPGIVHRWPVDRSTTGMFLLERKQAAEDQTEE